MSKRLFLSFLGLLLASHSACASRPHTGGGQFEFQVEDEAGNPFRLFIGMDTPMCSVNTTIVIMSGFLTERTDGLKPLLQLMDET